MRRFAKKVIYFIPILVLTIGCETANTVLVYEAAGKPEKPTKVGYSQFTFEEKNEYRGKGSIRCFDSTMAVVFSESDISFTKVHIPNFEELDKVNLDYLIRQCEKHGLDGIFLTELKLEAVHQSNYGHDYMGTAMDCSVDIQFVNSEGKLISHAHGLGSSRLGKDLNEKAYYAVSDATEATMWRILKVLR